MRAIQLHQLLLYDDPHSEYCAKVKVVLHHKQLNWRAIPVGGCGQSKCQSFKQQVPLGKIPALLITRCAEPCTKSGSTPSATALPASSAPEFIGSSPVAPASMSSSAAADGQPPQHQEVLYESEVINEWLEEVYKQPPMLPEEPLLRAQARLVSRFHDIYLEPALRQLYPQVSPATRNHAAVSAAAKEFLQNLEMLDKQLLVPKAQFAVSDCLGLADCGYPGLLLYAQMIFPVLGLGQLDFADLGMPRVASWYAALLQECAVVKVLNELRPAAQAWLDSKLQQSQ